MNYNEHDLIRAANAPTFIAAPVIIAGSAVTARSAQLPVGRYRVVSDTQDIFVRQGDVTVVATATDSYIPVNTNDFFFVNNTDTNGYLAVIAPAGVTTVQLTKVG